MTVQIPDELLLGDKRFSVHVHSKMPRSHPALRKPTAAEREASGVLLSTACWRCYIATWQIEEGRLALVQIRGAYALRASAPVFASWVSEVLHVPMGKVIAREAMIDNVCENELVIEVSAGRVGNVVLVDCKSTCPLHIRRQNERLDKLYAKLDPMSRLLRQPSIALSNLRRLFGNVQEAKRPLAWWQANFPVKRESSA